ncbi:MAG: MerR family transcriptional regulator [Ignavibacterium sp.]
MNEYFVGQLAKEAGINVETVRYYEKLKLIPKPKRRESRYRVYDETDLKRLLFIKRAKELGFTLK